MIINSNYDRVWFMNWLAEYCPNLYLVIMNNLRHMGKDVHNAEVAKLFDNYASLGLLWCLNWEMTAKGQPSLN